MILFVSVSGWLGGPARSLATVLGNGRPMIERVLACPRGELSELAVDMGFVDRFIDLPRSWRWRKTSRVAAAWVLTVWIVRNRRSISAIHANGLSELSLVAFGALLTGIDVIVWYHSSIPSRGAGRAARLWRNLLPRIRWVAVSDVAREVLSGSTGIARSSVGVIPNPIDPKDVLSEEPTESPVVRIGYLGSASQVKGFRILPTVMRHLSAREIDVEWRLYTRFVADSTEIDTWRAIQAIPNVNVIGRQTNVSEAYASCDLIFMPSERESFGRVAAEAMLNGIPVVASDLPALRELIGENEAGILFEAGKASCAAAAIGDLATNPEKRRQMGKAGMARAARFSPDVVVSNLEALYGIDDGQSDE